MPLLAEPLRTIQNQTPPPHRDLLNTPLAFAWIYPTLYYNTTVKKHFLGASKALHMIKAGIIKSFFLKPRLSGLTLGPGFTLSNFEEKQMCSNVQICSNMLYQACIINLSHSPRKNSFCPYKSYIFGKFISCVTLLSCTVVT